MAKHVLRNAYLRINGVDLSARADSVTINMSASDIDVTSFQPSGGVKQHLQGMRDDSFVVDFFQDFAAAQVDKTLQPLFLAGTEFEVKVAAQGSVISDTNPAWESGQCILMNYSPIAGKVGDANKISVTFASNAQIARVIT